ncbi:hypothetical protein TeGR_g13239, partial [Tetraparma gracilis]
SRTSPPPPPPSAVSGGTSYESSSNPNSAAPPSPSAPIRVGSAAGWELVVSPGDHVVHRKYGVGVLARSFHKIPPPTRAEKSGQAQRLQREIDRARAAGLPPPPTPEPASPTLGTEDRPGDPRAQLTLEIQYSDGLLHVPASKAYRLSRFRPGSTGPAPRLSKMGGGAWEKKKEKVRQGAHEIAEEVLALYATRDRLRRPPFSDRLSPLVANFSATFPYPPTPDQARCFAAVEQDMVYRTRPMDRLICGDVGFGKTEVAFRALYRCVAAGRQAALLAPTTVLAGQHYKNLAQRMEPFGVRVAMLRGRVASKYRGRLGGREQVKEGSADGTVDIVVGTHALLSKDMAFKDLGLLVVDEEQRFGVKQKERLKM